MKIKKLIWVWLFFLVPALHAAEVDFDALNAEAKRHLINLINIDTSQPDAVETEAARYIYKELNKHAIDWDFLSPQKGKANLLARIKGSDKNEKPLLLISHFDTADAGDGWAYPPFKATEVLGNIYGLGATDAKNYTAVHLAIFTWLKDQNITPKRDIILLVTSGEEVGSSTGLKWLGDVHWKKINAGYALNEGGGIIKNSPRPIVFAEASTKMYMDIKVTAYGTATHSSIPLNDNAVYRLSQALSKISAYNPEARITPTTREFFKAIAPLQEPDAQTTLNILLYGKEDQAQMAAEIMAKDPFFRSQLKDTINPTVISAGKDAGSASGEASAILNVRLMPTTDPNEFFEELKNLFREDENINLEVLEGPQLPFPKPMDGQDELFAAIRTTATHIMPTAITVPGLSPASGDSEYLRRLGVITYGLGPSMDENDENLTHTANEFISEEDLYEQLHFLLSVINNFALNEPILPHPPTDTVKESSGETTVVYTE